MCKKSNKILNLILLGLYKKTGTGWLLVVIRTINLCCTGEM